MAILKQRQTINAGGTRRRRHARTTRGKNKRDRRRENRKRYEGLFDLIRKQQKNKLENDSLDNTMYLTNKGITNLTRLRTDSEKENTNPLFSLGQVRVEDDISGETSTVLGGQFAKIIPRGS